MILHAKLAVSLGIPEENIIVAEDGDLIEVTPNAIKLTGHTAIWHSFQFDQLLHVGDVGQIVLRDRRALSQDGILIAVLDHR